MTRVNIKAQIKHYGDVKQNRIGRNGVESVRNNRKIKIKQHIKESTSSRLAITERKSNMGEENGRIYHNLQ